VVPESCQLEVCLAFDTYCKRTLRNEAINAHKSINRRKQIILNFSDLPVEEEYLFVNDGTLEPEADHLISGKLISNQLLTASINKLPDQLRRIIHLYYFDEFNDRTISEMIQVPKSTVQYWRVSALSKLRYDIEKNADDWAEILTTNQAYAKTCTVSCYCLCSSERS